MCSRAAARYARGESRRDPLMTQGLRLLDLHLQRCPQHHKPEVIGDL